MPLKRYYIILGFIFIGVFILSLSLPLLSYQEARRIVIVQESFLRHSLIPTYNGEPYFTKPPLYTWISLPFFALGSIWDGEVFTLRMISLLSYLGIAFLLYLISKRDPKKTLLAILILFSSFRFFSFVFRLDIEPLFVFFTTLSLYFLLKYRENPKPLTIYLFYLSFALAFLVRGPLHFFLVPAFVIMALLLRDRNLLKLVFFIPGWLLLLIAITPWFLYGYFVFGKEVFYHFLHTDIGERLTAKKDPYYYYLRAFILNFAPYLILLLYRIKHWSKAFRECQSDCKIYLGSFLIPILLLSFTGEKFDKYLLFIYPLASLFLTDFLLKLYKERMLYLLASIIVLLNFTIISIIHLHQREDINLKITLWKRNLLPQEKYQFYKELNPLALYLLKKPCTVVKKDEPLKEMEKDTFLISPEELKELTPSLVLPDPYKKGKFWYVYKN